MKDMGSLPDLTSSLCVTEELCQPAQPLWGNSCLYTFENPPVTGSLSRLGSLTERLLMNRRDVGNFQQITQFNWYQNSVGTGGEVKKNLS